MNKNLIIHAIISFYRPSGEAIAEFSSKESVEAAMKMNKEYLGERFVVLTAIDF